MSQKRYDLHERLRPLRRLLDDLEAAVEETRNMEHERAVAMDDLHQRAAAANAIEEECEKLREERYRLTQELEDVKRQHQAEIARLQAQKDAVVADLMEELEDQRAELTMKKTQEHATHVQYMESLARARADAEAESARIRQRVLAVQAQLRGDV